MGKCYQSTVIQAPREKVWDTIKYFHEMSWCAPVISSVEKVGDLNGLELGAKRILNEAFHETLIALDEGNFTFAYSIDDGLGPVAKDAVENYRGEVFLYPVTDTDQTFIEWTSSFESNTGDDVSDFCNPIYAAALNALKEYFK